MIAIRYKARLARSRDRGPASHRGASWSIRTGGTFKKLPAKHAFGSLVLALLRTAFGKRYVTGG